MLRILLTFAPIAGLLTITPGAATALVVAQRAARGAAHQPCQPQAGRVLRCPVSAVRASRHSGAAGDAGHGGRDRLVDLVWYSALAALVARAKRQFIEGGWARRFERLTGAVLLGLGVRLALERR